MTRPPIWLWISLVLSAGLALFALSFRARSEIENRAVGLLVEATVLEDLASLTGKPVSEIARELKGKGLTGVAMSERSVGDLIDSGELITQLTYEGIHLRGSTSGIAQLQSAITFAVGDPTAIEWVQDGVVIDANPAWVRSLSVGLDPLLARTLNQEGLEIVARHGNSYGMTEPGVTRMLASSSELGARYFLPSGDQVIGNRTLLKFTAEELRRLKMTYVTPEFVKISGDSAMVASMLDQTVRLHSIQQAEIDRMSPGAAYERYVKAFRERNIRWLLIRPMTLAAPDSLASLGSSLDSLRQRLAREGGAVKPPRAFQDPAMPHWLGLLLALAALPSVAWVVMALVPAGPFQMAACGLAGVLALATWMPDLRSYYALLIALAFPVMGFLLLDWSKSGIVIRYLAMSGLSLLGGLVVAGLLVSHGSLIQSVQFSGVKAAQFLPIFVVVWVLVGKTIDLKSLPSRPIVWGSALLGIVGLVALYLLIGRSGNDSPAAVSGLELKFRSLLDQLLYARPRTKEFLIGHPALIVGLGMIGLSATRPGLKPWAAVALGLGVVGQTGIVNTMCHLHSPLDLSLARIALGVLLGGIIGAVVWVVFRGTLVRREGKS